MPSANDNFASRIALTPVAGGTASFDNTGNTIETNESGGGHFAYRSAWYEITPTNRRIFRWRITDGSNASAIDYIVFYGDDTGPSVGYDAFRLKTAWALNDGGPSTQRSAASTPVGWAAADINAWREFQLPAGDVEVQVFTSAAAYEGTVGIEWEELTPPANDDWADAVVINGLTGTESGTLVGATWDTALTSAWPSYTAPGTFTEWTDRMRGVVWYRFEPADHGVYRFTLTPTGSGEDMRLISTYGDTYEEQERIGWGMPDETIEVPVGQIGQGVFYIGVVAMNLGSSDTDDSTRWRDTFDLDWEFIEPPVNDEWEDAEVLVGASGTASNDTLEGSTVQPSETYQAEVPESGLGSVWYEFSPATSGLYELTTGSSLSAEAYPRLDVMSGTTLADMARRELYYGWTSEPPMTLQAAMRAGDTYWFRMSAITQSDGYMGGMTDLDFGTFDWAFLGTAPANDDFADAEVITGASGTVSGDNSFATHEMGEYGSAYDAEGEQSYPQSVWYEWEAPSSGFFRFWTSVADTAIDTDLEIFTGDVLEDLEVAVGNFDGFDPAPDYSAILEFEAVSGVVYRIRVQSFSAFYAGAFDLEWATATAPGNDDFLSPTTLASTESGGPTFYDNLGADPFPETDEPDANTESGEPDFLFGRAVWFSWVPPFDSTYEFTINAPGFGAFWMLYELDGTASFDNLTLVDIAEIQYDTVSIQFPADAAKTYYIRVIGVLDTGDPVPAGREPNIPQGQFDIEWVRVLTPPDNDDLTSAIDDYDTVGNIREGDDGRGGFFTPSGGRYAATSLDATAEAGELSVAGFGPARTVWFYWQSAYTGTARFWTESTENTDMVMAAYAASAFNPAAPGTLLDADDDSGTGLMPQVEFAVTQFDDYFLQVDTKDNPGGAFTLEWVRVVGGAPPANDNFADAIEVVGDTVTLSGTVTNATAEADEPGGDFSGPHNTAWYKISSPVDRGIEITLKSTSNNNPWGIRAILYRGNTIDTITDATDGNYPQAFALNDEETVIWQLVGGVDHYIAVSGNNEQQGTFDVTSELSSLTPPTGDPFATPIDSGTGAGTTAGDTEGATLEAGEPNTTNVVGTVWHTFTPDFDGIYYFHADRGGGDSYEVTVWEGSSLSSIKAVPGYSPSDEGFDPRVLRKDTEYRIRVERRSFETWGTYDLNITAYPDYEDWSSDADGFDSVTGAASYDSGNDQLTVSGGVGIGSIEPWRDLSDNPQNAGRRWVELRFKMRVPDGRVMNRVGFGNRLGVVQIRDEDDDPVFGLAVVGNLDGTNSLAIYNSYLSAIPLDPEYKLFAHFGEGERSFNEWVDVEVSLSAKNFRDPDFLPTTYYAEVSVNGVDKKSRATDSNVHFTDTYIATAPLRTVEWGAYTYPIAYQPTVDSVLGQEPHDTWEIEIKDMVIRNRPTLGPLPSTDVADQGITHFDGWEHGDKLNNVVGSQATIVDAPGTPPGNSDWWKALRVTDTTPGGVVRGGATYSWIGNPKPWAGFWVYFAEWPDFSTDLHMAKIAQFLPETPRLAVSDDGYEAFGVLTITRTGQLRIISSLTERTWWSECVAQLKLDTWYWIEYEVDCGVRWDNTVRISINGISMGTFGESLTVSEMTSIHPSLTARTYTGVWPAQFPVSFEVGISNAFASQTSFNGGQNAFMNVAIDVYFAHVCFGRAVPWPQGALQTKLFEGHDGDGTHYFPELPAEFIHLDKSPRAQIWTLYDYVIENDTDPSAVGTNYFYYSPLGPLPGTVDIVADGSGPTEISGYANAVRWTARTPLNDGAFGPLHRLGFGFAQRNWYPTAEGGSSSDMYVGLAWLKGTGTLNFRYETHPGFGFEYSGADITPSGTYTQTWMAAYPAYSGNVASDDSWIGMEWRPVAAADEMRWKRPSLLRNPIVYPRFALSSDAGATWTMLEDPTVSNTSDNLGQDVAASSSEAVWMNNTSAIKRLMETRSFSHLPFTVIQMASPGYQATEWYLEYLAPPSIEIPEAEEFGGTRGYNLHLRHGGYDYTPSTTRATGDLYVTLWDGTHRCPMHVVTASATDISRVRYPTDPSAGHWTTTGFDDILMRFGYYRYFGSGTVPATGIRSDPTAYSNFQLRGAYLESLQWEVLSQAAPGPVAPPCRRIPQMYRRSFG